MCCGQQASASARGRCFSRSASTGRCAANPLGTTLRGRWRSPGAAWPGRCRRNGGRHDAARAARRPLPALRLRPPALAAALLAAGREADRLGHEHHGGAADPRFRQGERTLAMGKKVKTAAAVAVPKDRGECNILIEQIGAHQRERERLQTEMNAELAKLKTYYEQRAK